MQVRDMLIAAAKAQDLVLAIPAPSVLFAEFSDWALKFNLICFVDDIELGERTRSDINFDVLRRMREANLRIPYPALPPPKPRGKLIPCAASSRRLSPRFPADDRLLARQAPMVAGERARAPEHAMTGHDERDRVAADRGPDGARRLRACRSCGRCPNRSSRIPSAR